jgi:hypothetical protein
MKQATGRIAEPRDGTRESPTRATDERARETTDCHRERAIAQQASPAKRRQHSALGVWERHVRAVLGGVSFSLISRSRRRSATRSAGSADQNCWAMRA